jgi:U3 small nucleolar RNA-associated protein 18
LEEEQRLAASLFGGGGGVFTGSSTLPFSLDPAGKDEEAGTDFFRIDRVGDAARDNDLVATSDDGDGDQQGPPPPPEERRNDEPPADEEEHQRRRTADGGPAWVDRDDDARVSLLETSRLRKLRTSRAEEAPLPAAELEGRLRDRFRSTAQQTARTDWAEVSDKAPVDESNEEEEDGFKNSSASLLRQTGRHLPPNLLSMKRCPDANLADPNRSVVQATHFHPASDEERPLLLTAGLDKTLRFFQVSADGSDKIHGVHFPKLPIYCAQFLGTTGNVVVTGRRPFFYLYDTQASRVDLVPRITGRDEKSLETCVASPDGRTLAFGGNDGYVILFDAHTKSWMCDLKMNGSVRAITFAGDGDEMLASGSDGDVYRWDLRNNRKCIERFANQDGTITSSLAVSSRTLAVGAESGVVNLYSERQARCCPSSPQSSRTPLKSIMNLQTSADALRFNPDGQILALSSRRERNAVKLLHVPTQTVFSNWPTSKTPVNYCWSMDFSPGSKFFVAGNDKGRCLLYKMMHYDDNDLD